MTFFLIIRSKDKIMNGVPDETVRSLLFCTLRTLTVNDNFIGVLTPVAGVCLFRVGLKVLIPTIRKRILLDA